MMEVAVTRAAVRNHFGETKTRASRKPVPLHPSVQEILAEWRTTRQMVASCFLHSARLQTDDPKLLYCKGWNGRHERTRTADLFRVKEAL
jgi:hypothetical protein